MVVVILGHQNHFQQQFFPFMVLKCYSVNGTVLKLSLHWPCSVIEGLIGFFTVKSQVDVHGFWWITIYVIVVCSDKL